MYLDIARLMYLFKYGLQCWYKVHCNLTSCFIWVTYNVYRLITVKKNLFKGHFLLKYLTQKLNHKYEIKIIKEVSQWIKVVIQKRLDDKPLPS